VVAHLGSGASICAMKQRKSVATTMALDGLVMSRRCGSLDPGVVLYLIGEKGMTAAPISDLLYQSSGLLGVSGLSDDIKTLLASDKRMQPRLSTCSSTASVASWDRWPPLWVGLMPSFSPRALARTLV
jgi:acetate kinase